MIHKRSSEKGQAIVVLALGLVAMLGFTALALDGGMVYSDRRQAQSVSDASSLAGAGTAAVSMDSHGITFENWDCNSSAMLAVQNDAIAAAINRAAANGFTLDTDVSDNHGVTTVCGVEDNGVYVDKYLDINTQIFTTTDTNFAQVVFSGPLESQVEAVARVRPRNPLAFGYAIVALNENDCMGHQNGVVISGNSDVHVNGGGIFSYGCLRGNGRRMITDVTNGGISYVEDLECYPPGCTSFSPQPSQVPARMLPKDMLSVPAPDCSGLPNRGSSTQGGTISPGVYSQIALHGANRTLTMEPGLYCVTGQANALLFSGGTVVGDGVTIYVPNGNVSITGNAEVSLLAPSSSPDPSPAIPGVVIYLAQGNSNELRMEGNANSQFSGTVYAPSGEIVARCVSGLGPSPFQTQLIAYNVEFDGNTDIYINFDSSLAYHRPPRLELFK
ncbi:MAG: hypothetical protein GXP40_11205 [Chloroflexi bacterium]|nr:hypothetical protein [Chloroflexota bacterium]